MIYFISILILLWAFCTAWVLMLILTLVYWGVRKLGGRSFLPANVSAQQWMRTQLLVTAGIAMLLFVWAFWPSWVPVERTFCSPDENYKLTIGFYEELISPERDYRVKMVLRDSSTGERIGQVKTGIRGVFVASIGYDPCWDQFVRVEWDERQENADRVRVLFLEANRAYLLPSGEPVSPLSELEPLTNSTGASKCLQKIYSESR